MKPAFKIVRSPRSFIPESLTEKLWVISVCRSLAPACKHYQWYKNVPPYEYRFFFGITLEILKISNSRKSPAASTNSAYTFTSRGCLTPRNRTLSTNTTTSTTTLRSVELQHQIQRKYSTVSRKNRNHEIYLRSKRNW